MSTDERGQVTATAATIYDDFFVPALFSQWAEPMVRAADLRPGDAVLDVACGTGALTTAVAAAVGPQGRAVGLDLNDGMLDVARRKAPQIDWVSGAAEALPFEDDAFDAVVCQFGLMFVADRARALAEMRRVVRPRGAIAVAVWAPLARSPGYAALADLLDELFGTAAGDALRAPFVLGDGDALRLLLTGARLASVDVAEASGTARFPSLESWMFTEIRGWTLADTIDDAAFDRLLVEAARRLDPYVRPDGSVEFDVSAQIGRAIVPE